MYFEPHNILLDMNEEKNDEMTKWEHGFLCGLIKENRPSKIIEIGVAAGGTTAVIMDALRLQNIKAEINSVDISNYWYLHPNKKTGYIGNDAFQIINRSSPGLLSYKLYIEPKGIAECISEIGPDIDFAVIDTAHYCPGEILDFLAVLPYLSSDCVVVLHDINLHYLLVDNGFATQLLMDTVTADKIIYSIKEDEIGYPNIGAFRINEYTKKNIIDVFSALLIPWDYIPNKDYLNSCRTIFEEYYENKCLDIFDISIIQNTRRIIKRKEKNTNSIISYVRLLSNLRDKNVYIYGEGKYGKKLHQLLTESGIDVLGHVLSDDREIISEGTIHISEYAENDTTALVVGVGWMLKDSIVKTIERRKILNYYTLDDDICSLLHSLCI